MEEILVSVWNRRDKKLPLIVVSASGQNMKAPQKTIDEVIIKIPECRNLFKKNYTEMMLMHATALHRHFCLCPWFT
jgi:hypothetical protein